MGILNISLADLDLLAPADVLLALSWKRHYDEQLFEADYRNTWEQTRLLAAYTIAPHSKNKIKNLRELFPLDWDEKTVKVETPEEREKRLAMFAKWDKQAKNQTGGS